MLAGAERLLGGGDLAAARSETLSAALFLDAAGDAVDLQDQVSLSLALMQARALSLYLVRFCPLIP